jgi:hypothetical protein
MSVRTNGATKHRPLTHLNIFLSGIGDYVPRYSELGPDGNRSMRVCDNRGRDILADGYKRAGHNVWRLSPADKVKHTIKCG